MFRLLAIAGAASAYDGVSRLQQTAEVVAAKSTLVLFFCLEMIYMHYFSIIL